MYKNHAKFNCMSFNKCAFKKNYLEKNSSGRITRRYANILSDFLIKLFLFVCFIHVPQQNEKAGLSDAHQNDIKVMLSKIIRSVTVIHHTNDKIAHFIS